mmetsp:Transcript_20783/g.30766  ORF Transcript_20783/g.30766 Transcript_20783/m.30766 type:complete len:199 (+) Transcript_20783:128-724(+)
MALYRDKMRTSLFLSLKSTIVCKSSTRRNFQSKKRRKKWDQDHRDRFDEDDIFSVVMSLLSPSSSSTDHNCSCDSPSFIVCLSSSFFSVPASLNCFAFNSCDAIFSIASLLPSSSASPFLVVSSSSPSSNSTTFLLSLSFVFCSATFSTLSAICSSLVLATLCTKQSNNMEKNLLHTPPVIIEKLRTRFVASVEDVAS